MEFIRLDDPYSREFKKAWEIYESSFPPDEKRTLELQRELSRNSQYRFFVILKGNALVAIITDWDFGDFLFVEHFAVKEEFRGRGIGAELLKEYLSRASKEIILEVERPDTEVAARRIKFYERAGFKLNRFDYIQPPYGKDKNPVPSFLMTYPEKISESEFFSIRERLHTTVYGLEKPLV